MFARFKLNIHEDICHCTLTLLELNLTLYSISSYRARSSSSKLSSSLLDEVVTIFNKWIKTHYIVESLFISIMLVRCVEF